MALSKTSICNLALLHLGHSKRLANVESDQTAAANICRTVYDQARDEALRDSPWPFAAQRGALGLVEANPNAEWAYAYRYPDDCLFLRRLLSDTRDDGVHVSYRLGQDDEGELIFTDRADAEAEWTVRVEDTGRYPPDFVQMLSSLIAAYAGPALTGGDEFKLSERALRMYDWARMRARANAANEEQPDQEADGALLRARG
ncbi:MAG TPA: hypothetical protein VJZ25_07020 [Gemmatimonadaceae bacterium]|nr:hypothetical protein [Gemmatimonadaceae bacterium]